MNFDTRNAHRTYDTATHKVVPKDAVVLDLDEIASHLSSGERLSQVLYALRASHAEERPADFTTNLKIAAAIEAQTKPPRIPEPGLWGVVRDDEGDYFTRDRKEGERWVLVSGSEPGSRWVFSDLMDPVLIREGVDS